MAVNGKSKVSAAAGELEIPAMIGIRTKKFRPLLEAWRRRNLRVPWTCLLRDALRQELAPLAGKRHAHLLDDKGKAAA